jgi:hypothetical protein
MGRRSESQLNAGKAGKSEYCVGDGCGGFRLQCRRIAGPRRTLLTAGQSTPDSTQRSGETVCASAVSDPTFIRLRSATTETSMRAESIERRIRAKAYELWREDGRMEGCADEYWRKARILVEAEIAEEDGRRGTIDGADDTDEAGNSQA